MFNPFAPLSKPLLEAFVKVGKKYFVRQTYIMNKGLFDESIKGSFIFTHYADIAHAQHHISAILHDPHRCLYEWDNTEDRRRLVVAAGNPAGYNIYSSVFVKDWEKLITDRLKGKVKKYIDYSLSWSPGRSDTVDFQVFITYGELYARLKLRRQEVRVKLEVIEKL